MKLTILLTAFSFFLLSCGNDTHDMEHEHAETDSHEGHQHEHAETNSDEEHQHEHNDNALELNNGEKWETNKEMEPYVEEGKMLVNNYISDNSKDYKKLASGLKEQNDKLISSCTMTGKSHDELHQWLQPHMELVKKLKNTNSEDKAEEIVHELKKSYKTYDEYFE